MNIRNRQLDFAYRQLSYSQLASFVCSVFLVFLLWDGISRIWLFGWFAALTTVSALRITSAYFFKRQQHDLAAYQRYRIIFIGGALLGGLGWAVTSLFLNNTGVVSQQFGIILIIAGITAGSISSNGTMLLGYFAFQVPVLLTLVVWLLLQQTTAYTQLAILTVFYSAMLTALAKRYRDQFVMLYEVNAKNKTLISDLSATNQQLQTEISTRRLTEDALRESELRFRNIIEAAPDAMVLANGDGDIVLANQQAVKLFGYSEEELLANKVEFLVPDRYIRHADFRQNFTHKPKPGKMNVNLTLFAKHRDGHEIPIDISLNTVPGKDILVSSSIRDISDHLQIENDLRQAKEEAEQANQAKSDFLSRMNHELRTPLNAIIGFSQVLKLVGTNSPQQNEQLTEIYLAGKHLLALINEMLDIAKIEAGHIELTMDSVKLGDVLNESISLTKPLMDKHQIQLQFTASELDDIYVQADRTRLKQVFINLLSNACKYNQDNGKITIKHSSAVSGRTSISITDTGPGISPEAQVNLFQPFNRLGAENSAIEGTGIGLTISKKLLEMMHGTITVKSEVGRGSTFSVELRQSAAPGIAQRA